MMRPLRSASLLVAFYLLTSDATATAECGRCGLNMLVDGQRECNQ